jgi:hypothetical protein
MNRKSDKAKIRELRNLVRHCWVHSGYRDCGYRHMSSRMRDLYNRVIRRPKKEREYLNSTPEPTR